MCTSKNLSIQLVNEKIILSHVIPDHLLFSRPALGREQKTATFGDDVGIQVTVAIERTRDGGQILR